MSVDSSALERATLERKDRDELVAIAQALGGKVASRAKKADIVDTILELTGVEPAAAPPAPAARSRRPAAATFAPEVAPEATAEVAADGADEADEAADDAEAETDDVDVVDDLDDKLDRGPGPEGSVQVPAQIGGERRPQQQQQRGPNGRPDQGGHNGGQGRGDGNPNQQNDRQNGPNDRQNGPNGLNDDGEGDDEGGNRRRRRRGRNRGDGPGPGVDEPMGDPVEVSGFVDLREEGYGFLRLHGFLSSRDDAYISVKQARQFGLRRGDVVAGTSRPALRNEKNPALLRIDTINGAEP
ncbi:MAG: hypothetical protein Q8K72_06915, partial [Acidimicrobiales bacterium]|nr:hypothetical protein [Acidimicrobiales bacterium]